ncbi:MAG: hypothetical protein KBC17_01530 [Candidatus Pacebacteria bacterium]|nr:hypothetical protein [Candidatus Paceibacterota bacterium]
MIFRKLTVNILVIVCFIISPLYWLRINQSDIRIVESIQHEILVLVLLGGLVLTYLNHKNRKQAETKKWVWTLFEIVGILGILYGGGILLILYIFRDCCGF